MAMLKSASVLILVGSLAGSMALTGCKIVKTPNAEDAAALDEGFNADKSVSDIWDAKVIPFFANKTITASEVLSAIKADSDAAGEKLGHRESQSTAPWTFVSTVEGKIIDAQTKSRAAYVDVDIDGDGAADLRVQIGPTIRGTAIRDSLDFISFNDFRNQIDWAQFGKSFNSRINEDVLSELPRENLTGQKIKATGAFATPAKGQLPLVTPVTISIGN